MTIEADYTLIYGKATTLKQVQAQTGIPVRALREVYRRGKEQPRVTQTPTQSGLERAKALAVTWAKGKRPTRDADQIRFLKEIEAAGGVVPRPRDVTAIVKGCTNSRVQSVVFDRAKWTQKEAKKWLMEHPEFEPVPPDLTPNTLRYRQWAPTDFIKGTYRTIPLGRDTGIQAVVGCPKPGSRAERTVGDVSFFVTPSVGGINMDAAALRAWAKDPRSALASTATGQASLRKLPGILTRYLSGKTTDEDRQWMKKTKDFNWRHLQQRRFGDEVKKSGYSARHIALLNWGHDPTRPDSPAYRIDKQWLKEHPGAAERRRGRA